MAEGGIASITGSRVKMILTMVFICRDHWWWLINHRILGPPRTYWSYGTHLASRPLTCATIISLHNLTASQLLDLREFSDSKAHRWRGSPDTLKKNHKAASWICSIMFPFAFLKRTGRHLSKEVHIWVKEVPRLSGLLVNPECNQSV